MKRTIAVTTTVLLVASVLSAAGPAIASSQQPGEGLEHGHEAEHNPNCHGANGDRQSQGITIDLSPAGINQEVGVPTDIGFDQNGDGEIDEEEQFFTFCSGEHWDGQDPNTQDSDDDTRANEDGDGNVYVNPLYGGDCSGWDDSHHADGCQGGADRPTFGEILHQRVTGDVPTASNPSPDVTVYYNGEMWGVGRMSIAVHYSHPDNGGYASTHLEDHSDQIFEDTIGSPSDDDSHPIATAGLNDVDNDGSEDFGGDGNYLTIPFDPIQQGTGAEGDCSSHVYQSDDKTCNRDNGAFATIQFGYAWAPLVSDRNVDTGPDPLP